MSDNRQNGIIRITQPIVSVAVVDAAPAREHGAGVVGACCGRPAWPVVGSCPQPECGGELVLIEHCPTCLNCGYSKCE